MNEVEKNRRLLNARWSRLRMNSLMHGHNQMWEGWDEIKECHLRIRELEPLYFIKQILDNETFEALQKLTDEFFNKTSFSGMNEDENIKKNTLLHLTTDVEFDVDFTENDLKSKEVSQKKSATEYRKKAVSFIAMSENLLGVYNSIKTFEKIDSQWTAKDLDLSIENKSIFNEKNTKDAAEYFLILAFKCFAASNGLFHLAEKTNAIYGNTPEGLDEAVKRQEERYERERWEKFEEEVLIETEYDELDFDINDSIKDEEDYDIPDF